MSATAPVRAAASPDPGSAAALRRLRAGAGRRWLLWGVLSLTVVGMLAIAVWLARGHEIEQVQRALERDSLEAVQVLRERLGRNLQDLHGLGAAPADPEAWSAGAARLLETHREWLRLEWRGAALEPRAARDSPFHTPLPAEVREAMAPELQRLCQQASVQGEAIYAPPSFVLRAGGLGREVMTLCLPLQDGARTQGFVLASYTLDELLRLLPTSLTRGQAVAFTELDGTRLALHGAARRGARLFVAQQTLDLPGAPMLLRLEGGRPLPDVFPNVLTALVTLLSMALLTALGLLARDFRRRQQAEAELAEALAFRKAMEDSLITGLRARDLQGRITYVNPAFCAMVGYTPQELIGQSTPAPYWPPERAHEYGARQALRLSGQAAAPREGVETEFMRKDGTHFPVLIFETPLITAQGQHSGWMGAVVDMTAQRRAEESSRASLERLQASARLATVGEMASLMSHELNQPLAAIASYASGSLNLLPAGAGGDAATARELRTALERIAEQAGRAGRVIHSVRELVRQRSTAPQAVAPRALVDAVLPLVQLQARKLGASVRVQVAPELPAVWCEPTMIEQVLLNLARNGLQAMAEVPGERLLTLQARLPTAPAGPALLEFGVADTGTGMDAAVVERLFTPFFTTKPEGMGLGLSLCRTVIEQHGGTLVHAPNLPRGTLFRFTLAVADAP